MAIEIIVPRLGWSMDEGTFSQWLKQDGEFVNEMEELFELESDKAVQQVESFDSGILRIPPDAPSPGDTVKVGQRLGYLCERGEPAPFEAADSPDNHASTSAAKRPPREPEPSDSTSGSRRYGSDQDQSAGSSHQAAAPPSVRRRARELGVDVQTVLTNGGIGHLAETHAHLAGAAAAHLPTNDAADQPAPLRVSPRAARAAAKFGVNLAEVRPTGTSGRIRERDVLAAVKSRSEAPTPPPSSPESATQPAPNAASSSQKRREKDIKPSSLRQTIAARMLAAAQQTAPVTLTSTADATQLVNVRKQFTTASADQAARGPSYTDLLVKLSAAALIRHPAMLAQWSDEGIVMPEQIDVAVAVDTPFGLLTPVLRNVPSLPLAKLSEQLRDLASRARERRLSPEELRGGCFTVTNLGGYRVDAFTPILNLPQTAILGVGRIRPQAVPVGGDVLVRDSVSLSLTFDHRVVDGATAAALVTTICELVEAPLPVLLS